MTSRGMLARLDSVLANGRASNLHGLVLVTLLRGLLSPVGHGTWTAILASVLFREGMPNRFRINRAVLGAYLTVVVLHGLWDGVPQLLTVIAGPGRHRSA